LVGMKKQAVFILVIAALVGVRFSGQALAAGPPLTLLNVSYDPTRELYQELNKVFIQTWEQQSGQKIQIQQSHGGSGKQARAVIDGLEADVVTLALAYDIDEIAARAKLLPENWQSRLPDNSSPYTSTIVFLVRRGNPKNIKDWDDLIKTGISVITPNPKTSGGARWNYLAAWGFAQKKYAGDESKVLDFMKALFKNVPLLDAGARGATTTFVQRGIGDVLLAWENEAFLAVRELGAAKLEIVVPSFTILAEPPVALVDKYAERHGTTKVAEAYLRFLYSEAAQEIIARHYYRPRLESAAKKYEAQFPQAAMFTIADLFGSWQAAQKKHFNDGGTFDQIYAGS